jgi:hypothetical protein
MSYHFFTDNEFAGPGPAQLVSFWDRTPRQLRPKPRQNVPVLDKTKYANLEPITTAKHEDAARIATFWNNYYTGPDWKFHSNMGIVTRAIKNGVILIIWNTKREPIATFVCRYLSRGIKCGVYNSQVGLLEGLVIHPMYRGRGLASYMLVAMDNYIYNLPEMSQSILMWFREHDTSISAMSQVPCAVLTYYYAHIGQIQKSYTSAQKAAPEIVESVLKTIYDTENFTLMSGDSKDPDVYWYLAENSLIGIADTHRIGNDGSVLWEVVFASNLSPPFFTNHAQAIELAALQLPSGKGVIFASNGKTRGNFSTVGKPWLGGRAGHLSMHVYNWMPPALLSGDILFPHGCI